MNYLESLRQDVKESKGSLTERKICNRRAKKLRKRNEEVVYDFDNKTWVWFMKKFNVINFNYKQFLNMIERKNQNLKLCH